MNKEGGRKRGRTRGRNLVPPCAALPRLPRSICRSRAIPSPRAGRRFFSPHVSPRGEKERGDVQGIQFQILDSASPWPDGTGPLQCTSI
ncbi:hypothetical protein GW17_00030569 [Ensete ventricosum]|nr:hypothetical protein GW17_00030569 [Ensete ventricosum]